MKGQNLVKDLDNKRKNDEINCYAWAQGYSTAKLKGEFLDQSCDTDSRGILLRHDLWKHM